VFDKLQQQKKMLRRGRIFFCVSEARKPKQRSNFLGYCPHEPVEGNSLVYFDITTERRFLGRVTIELFNDVVPRTAENFRSLCTGERGMSDGCPLFFKGIPFHRIVPNFVIQGGDVKFKDGRGTTSIFGYPFYDESFEGKAGKHLSGTIAMSSSGPNQNGSQFFINMRDSPHLNGRFVVCGQILTGWDTLQEVSRMGSRCGTPLQKVWVAESGQLGGAKYENVLEIPNDPANFDLGSGKEVLDMLAPRTSSGNPRDHTRYGNPNYSERE
jgi:cyclophilin family peptidyl-prolyl cis-trans isomerase